MEIIERRKNLKKNSPSQSLDLADRNDIKDNKVPLHLIGVKAMYELARVLEFGAQKYSEWNWMKGLPYMRTVGSLRRHLDLWIAGEDYDSETGLSHLAHAMCNIMFLLEWEAAGKGDVLDDRPYKKYL